MDGSARLWRKVAAALRTALLSAPLALPAAPAAGEGLAVDVELVLAVDVSSSMKPVELALQRQGYAAAIRAREVIDAMLSGRHGRVAVTYVEWGASGSRRVVVPWTLVAAPQDALAVAERLAEAELGSLFQTSISGAIRYAMRAFADSPYAGDRRIVDISGDGPNNQGGLVTLSRDAALAEGITINGLPLVLHANVLSGPGTPSLDRYYADCVVGGPRAFVLPVRGWDAFPAAVRRKLVLELSDARPALPGAARPSARPRDAAAAAPVDCTIGETLWRGAEPV